MDVRFLEQQGITASSEIQFTVTATARPVYCYLAPVLNKTLPKQHACWSQHIRMGQA